MNINQVLQDHLTPVQYRAAVDPASEVLCLACAGSGKSRTLAYRIARLLATGASPQSIVAFTFTNKAAAAIKQRVAQALQTARLDPTVLGAMYIGTIHTYCQRVLGDMDPIYRQYDVLDENRLRLFLMSRYAQLNLRAFRDNPRYNQSQRYFDVITQAVNAWTMANDEVLDFTIIKNTDPQLGIFLQEMGDLLQRTQYLDFSLMIRLVVDALQAQKPEVLQAISTVRHLMVDEYQDVNLGQEHLIRLLGQRAATLFVVGDDDQAIYAWRGADVGHILEFQKRYPGCKVHTLNVNFRSTTPIVQAADYFAATELSSARRAKQPVAYANLTPQACQVLPLFPDRNAEAAWIAKRIQDLLGTTYQDAGKLRGLTPADFAILMRSTRVSDGDGKPRHTAFTQALEALDIPFSLERGGSPFGYRKVTVLRDTFELMRAHNPPHHQVEQFFKERVRPTYRRASFHALARVLSRWGSRIHRTPDSPRERLYPQELLYDLLGAYNLADMDLPDDVMQSIGLFSRMLQDVETVYISVDSRARFASALDFLMYTAATGYNTSTDNLVARPDAVMVSTVHGMKGLEFPCVFVVDMEAQRFPGRVRKYAGWLPQDVISSALERGAYQTTHDGEARLFYTAVTRAERYLYVSGATELPGGRRRQAPSLYAQRLAEHPGVTSDKNKELPGLSKARARRRIEETSYPTSVSEIQNYLQCPRIYQFRQRYGFKPVIKEMFGYGQSVRTCIQQLHQHYPDSVPDSDQVTQVVADTFHLKHVPASKNPDTQPGPYERARTKAIQVLQNYVRGFSRDFTRERQIKAAFEIPAQNCTIAGAIDLLLQEDEQGSVLDAEVVDFKTREKGLSARDSTDLDWPALALQVQLYTTAAEQVLDQPVKTGNVHFLQDGHRVAVPTTPEALDAAHNNVEWAVQGILQSDFPMRPHATKCAQCDFAQICPQRPQKFKRSRVPLSLHLPDDRHQQAHAFSQYDFYHIAVQP